MKLQAKARIQFVVEIVNPSAWGVDCTMTQVYEQAARESEEQLRSVLGHYLPNGKILGEPIVTAILVNKDDS